MAYLTENELVERFQYYTLQLESQLLRGDDFHALADAIPFQVHLNDPDDLGLIATNRAFDQQFGYEYEEIQSMGAALFQRCVHPQSLAVYPQLLQRSKTNPSSIFTFVHHLWLQQIQQDYSPVITFTKPSKLPGGIQICLSPLPENFGSMVDKVNQVIEIDEFKLKHFSRFQRLTPREIEILKLLCLGNNNSQISEQLRISRLTVETHRKNLKAKLELGTFRDAMRFALAFELIEL